MLLLLVAGCVPTATPVTDPNALMDVDRAWSTAAAAGTNPDSVLSLWAEDARVVMAGDPTHFGKNEIRKMVEASFKAPGFHVSWVPERATIAASGDLGYTVGSSSCDSLKKMGSTQCTS